MQPYGVDVAGGVEREPGVKDLAQGGGVRRREAKSRRMSERRSAGHFGPFGGRYVAETLIPALDELDARLARRPGRPRVSRASSTRCFADYVGRPSPLTFADQLSRAVELRRRRASTSSARTSTTPARTRSTTASARRCWRGAWASGASSPRPAPASTAWPRRRWRPCSASPARSTWAPRTSSGRRSTSSA